MFSKLVQSLLVVGAMSAMINASAIAQKRTADAATCDYVITPTTALPSDANFTSEINFVIGRSFAVTLPSGTSIFGDISFTPNADGTFSVHAIQSAEGKTGAQSAALIEGLQGQTEEGFSTNWVYNSVICEA